MKIGFVTFQLYEGRADIGSSRIRAEWLCKYWEEAELYKQGQQYDVLIFQKAYWTEMAKEFKGIKIFDLCDPDFLHWGYKTKEMLDNVDAITTSTEKLAEAMRQFTDKPVICVPDRMDLAQHMNQKKHEGDAKLVGWFGYVDNSIMLDPVLPYLEKLGLDLKVISNKSYLPPISHVRPEIERGMGEDESQRVLTHQKKHHWIELTNIKWNNDTYLDELLDCDIIVNPTSTKGKWGYKSNNKTLTAWALGIPVANTVAELKKYINPDERIKEAALRRTEIVKEWEVKSSVTDYIKIINDLTNKKK